MKSAGPFTHLVCGVDFSDESCLALDWAIALAAGDRANLTLLSICPPAPMPVTDLPMPSSYYEPDAEEARRRMTPLLDRAKAAGVAAGAIVDVGRPAAAIVERVKTIGADLLVVGTHGRSGFDRLVMGSVAEKVLRRAGCAVLTVPPRVHSTASLPFKRVLCAVDFSPWSIQALALAARMARMTGASLTVLHVLEWPWEEPPPPAFGEFPSAEARALEEFHLMRECNAATRLRAVLAESDPAGTGIASRVVHGKAYERILAVADEEQSDLIVSGVHGRKTLDLALLGSTTNQLVRRAKCPVLTLRH